MKQAKLQWFQNQSQTNTANMNNAKPKMSETFRNKWREPLRGKN
jgi:hypothetical protein